MKLVYVWVFADFHQVYVDTVGPAESYQLKLSQAFPGIKFKVSAKVHSLI